MKCGECKFVLKLYTPICGKPTSINYGNEVAENDYCTTSEQPNSKKENDKQMECIVRNKCNIYEQFTECCFSCENLTNCQDESDWHGTCDEYGCKHWRMEIGEDGQ